MIGKRLSQCAGCATNRVLEISYQSIISAPQTTVKLVGDWLCSKTIKILPSKIGIIGGFFVAAENYRPGKIDFR